MACLDTSARFWARHSDISDEDQDPLPIVTCKTSWGSAPNGQRYLEYCTSLSVEADSPPEGDTLMYRWKEISGSLKNKSANKCENRCDYQGPVVNSLSLWGCCGSYSDEELGC